MMISAMVSFFLLVITEKCNFKIFRGPLSFLSAIYNGEISLKEVEIKQRNLEKKWRV